jgi:hypothetical protein
MRSIRPVAVVYLYFALVLSTSAQQTTIQAPQASVFLQSALAALSGANLVTNVTLTGTPRRIAAILLLEPALNANYESVKQYTFPWPPKPSHLQV